MKWERQEGKEMVQDRLGERAVCDSVVCVPSEKTSNFAGDSYYIYIYIILKQGVTGVAGGSVTNEGTSPGAVQTYLLGFGGAPGRI